MTGRVRVGPQSDMDGPSRTGRSAQPVLVVGTHSVHVRRFVSGLCEAGQPVVLVTDGPERLVDHPLLIEQQQADFSMRSLGTAGVIRRSAERWQPRVVHAHQANSVAWHAARACKGTEAPLVITIWGSDVLVTPTQGQLKRRMVQAALRSASLWTADASVLLHAARELAGVDTPSSIIVMGVDELPADLSAVWPLKQDWALSCRLHKPLYRVDAVIRAFAAIAPAAPGWRLEVAASGVETPALIRVANECGVGNAVEFTGMLSPEMLTRSYLRSKLYLSVPSSDGTSVSLLEAMAHGCFPIVSDLPANREWIVDGLNGLVVANPGDLRHSIQRAMLVCESESWRDSTAPANHRLVREKALFADNIRQFMAQYVRLGR